MWGESKARRALVLAAVPAFSLLAGVGSAAAQPIFQPTFSDSQLCVTVDLENALLQGPIQYSPIHSVDLPAGEIVIPEAISWDEYDNRELTPTQTSERWELQFLDANGNVIAISDAVPDIADGVRRAEYIGALGSVTLPVPAVAVRAHHRTDLPLNNTPNSVHASGVTLCWEEGAIPPVCTNAAGDTIAANSDGTCPTAPKCTNAAGTTIAANPDGTCPTAPKCTNADGTTIAANPDGTCPTAPKCVAADGTAVASSADGSCPPAGPILPQCVAGDGTAATANADGSCPDPAPLGPVATPSQPSPAQPAGGTLPITGSESMILLFAGMWLLAAGTTATMFVRTR